MELTVFHNHRKKQAPSALQSLGCLFLIVSSLRTIGDSLRFWHTSTIKLLLQLKSLNEYLFKNLTLSALTFLDRFP